MAFDGEVSGCQAIPVTQEKKITAPDPVATISHTQNKSACSAYFRVGREGQGFLVHDKSWLKYLFTQQYSNPHQFDKERTKAAPFFRRVQYFASRTSLTLSAFITMPPLPSAQGCGSKTPSSFKMLPNKVAGMLVLSESASSQTQR